MRVGGCPTGQVIGRPAVPAGPKAPRVEAENLAVSRAALSIPEKIART